MKKIFLIFSLGLVLSCSGGGDDDMEPIPPPVVENTAPSVPSQVYPLNNTLCIDNQVSFQWNASKDDQGNSITYKIEISENSTFSSIVESATTSSTIKR